MSSNANWGQFLIPIVVLVLFGYFLIIRPQRRRAKEVHRVQDALSVGDEIMLTSGIFGRVLSVGNETLQLEVSQGVVVTAHRGAVAKIVRDEPGASPSAEPGVPPQEPGDTTTEPDGDREDR